MARAMASTAPAGSRTSSMRFEIVRSAAV